MQEQIDFCEPLCNIGVMEKTESHMIEYAAVEEMFRARIREIDEGYWNAPSKDAEAIEKALLCELLFVELPKLK